MKKFFGLSIFTAFIMLFTMQVGFVSCSKDNDTITIRDTVKVTDTVKIEPVDTTVTAQILTANGWKIQETRGVTGNAVVYYKRGGTANTQSFDNEYITFKADKTGTYTDNNGGQSALTWDFSNTQNTTLTATVNFPNGTIVLTWDHLCYKNKSIKYEEFYTSKGVNSHAYVVRIPK